MPEKRTQKMRFAPGFRVGFCRARHATDPSPARMRGTASVSNSPSFISHAQNFRDFNRLLSCIRRCRDGAIPRAAPGKAAPTAAPSPAATAATLAVDNLETLRTHLNETVDVLGTPTATGHSKSGTVIYLNFGPAHRAVAVVAFLSGSGGGGTADPAARKVQSEDELKPFVGKPTIIHGKLAEYKGDLQIVLDSLDQIKLAP